jgi:hypothetical protein
MNEDHGEATVAMVKHYIGIDVDKVGGLALGWIRSRREADWLD